MISFIVIGRNEGWKLTKCFKSIFTTIKQNCLSGVEIIYIDSHSTDDSLFRSKRFKTIKIFTITGKCNAAIARNIGVKESVGDYLFFIDGDMEINPDFLPLVYNEKNGLLYNFVSGNWINYEYNDKWSKISKSTRKNIKVDSFEFTTGGIFLIKRNLWFMAGGMKSKLNRSQDIDFGLRLAKKGFLLTRKKEIIAIHHTIPYNEKKRKWQLLLSGALFYKIVLLRDNFFNKYQWKLFLRENYTFLTLLVLCSISMITLNIYFLLIYFSVIFCRILLGKKYSFKIVVVDIFYFPICEISLFFALFLFWPKYIIEEWEQEIVL
mgnify:CR=1 FL=1|jgi:glycosyltransferase involved in cell wall biosynthesis